AGGMGKSRLLDELSRELAALGIPYLRGAGSETERAAPLALWRNWLLALLPVDPGMNHADAAAAIREALEEPEQQAWAEWLAAVVERAGGSPLFLDMLLRAAREAPDPLALLSTVPASVYALVQAQLDSLQPAERQAASSGSVLGRFFAERWLAALCRNPDAAR